MCLLALDVFLPVPSSIVSTAAGALLVGSGLRFGIREFLHRQAEAARRVVGKPLGEVAPAADGKYKKKYGQQKPF